MSSYRHINTLPELEYFVNNIFTSKNFAFDTEFTSLDCYDAEIIGLSVFDPSCIYEGTPVAPTYIQFNFGYDYTTKESDPNGGRKKVEVTHRYTKKDAIDIEEALPHLIKMFDGAEVITANGKVEILMAMKYGFHNFTVKHDVVCMSYMLDCTINKGLKDNGKRELGMDMPSYEDTIGMKVGNINWNKVDFEKYAEYAARDAFVTHHVFEKLFPRLQALPGVLECYNKLEIPLIPEVAISQMEGVEIDVPFLNKMSIQIAKDIEKLEKEIFKTCGVREFNLGSSKILGEVLYDRLGYPEGAMTKGGKRSVAEDTLKQLAYEGYEVAELILEHRKLGKLKSTYVDAIPLMLSSDGRLRGSFNQFGTETGRFSSSKPNLQNQPNNDEYPVRRSFVPKRGYKFIVVDWSTIEIRVMSHESNDMVLVELLNAGRDIHQETTDKINAETGLSLKRSDGKTLNFGVLYGMGAEKLAYTLNKGLRDQVRKGKITEEEYQERFVTKEMAQKMIDGFSRAYAGFTAWGEYITAKAKESGFVQTLGGRIRPLPELKSKYTYYSGKRKAINTMIQGGAGDLMKLGIIKLSKMYLEKNYDAKTLLYVHDEFVIEVKESQANQCLQDVIYLMNNIFPNCRVPILCEGGVFSSWADMKTTKKEVKNEVAELLINLNLL